MRASEIAKYLGKKLAGQDIDIYGFSSLSKPSEKSVVFVKAWNSKNQSLLESCDQVLAIVPAQAEVTGEKAFIRSNNPRLDFIKVVRHFFTNNDIPFGIHPTAVVEHSAKIDQDVAIGAHCYIGPEVSIASGTVIMPNVSIYGKVKIGHNCYIKPGAVIGGPGFGFEYDEDGIPLQFPDTGKIIIGDNVYIGANATIDRATLDATIIEDNVKIDNLVHIAHNCIVGKNTLMTGCSTISGGVKVGENCWIAPNSTVYQQLKIGANSRIGMGAVVLRSVKPGVTVFGNPASELDL